MGCCLQRVDRTCDGRNPEAREAHWRSRYLKSMYSDGGPSDGVASMRTGSLSSRVACSLHCRQASLARPTTRLTEKPAMNLLLWQRG